MYNFKKKKKKNSWRYFYALFVLILIFLGKLIIFQKTFCFYKIILFVSDFKMSLKTIFSLPLFSFV